MIGRLRRLWQRLRHGWRSNVDRGHTTDWYLCPRCGFGHHDGRWTWKPEPDETIECVSCGLECTARRFRDEFKAAEDGARHSDPRG